MRMAWIKALNLCEKHVPKKFWVCIKHFNSEDIIVGPSKARKDLKKGAIPFPIEGNKVPEKHDEFTLFNIPLLDTVACEISPIPTNEFDFQLKEFKVRFISIFRSI